ncbi:hypothetical protein KEM55_007681, partial [Ascosphaera atra]
MSDIRAMLRNELAARKSSGGAQGQPGHNRKRKLEAHAPSPAIGGEELRKRQRSGVQVEATTDAAKLARVERASGSMSGVEETEGPAGSGDVTMEAGPQAEPVEIEVDSPAQPQPQTQAQPEPQQGQAPPDNLDEEWALFEREVLPLAKDDAIAAAEEFNPSAVISAPA